MASPTMTITEQVIASGFLDGFNGNLQVPYQSYTSPGFLNQSVTFASGLNTITVPSSGGVSPTFCQIIPNAANATSWGLTHSAASSADYPCALTQPVRLTLNGTSSIYVYAAGAFSTATQFIFY